MPLISPARGPSRFLSLKWKILLTLGGVMLSVNGVLSWLHYQDLTARFTEQRAQTRQRLVKQAFSLRNDFRQRLQGLAGMLAVLDAVDVRLMQTPAGKALLRQHFDSYWPVLDFDLGIVSLQVYGKTGHPLVTWPSDLLPDSEQNMRVQEVIASERAMHWTRCRTVCTEFAAAPILSFGRVHGAVVLGSSPADVVNSFPGVSGGADLGVIIPSGPQVGIAAGETLLPESGLRVIELSDKGKQRPLLRDLRSIPPLPPFPDHAHLSVPYEGKYFELSFLALATPSDASLPAMMVIIDDLTEALSEIRESVLRHLQGTLLASLLSLLLLAFLVHAPLQ